MRISDGSSYVCSSDLLDAFMLQGGAAVIEQGLPVGNRRTLHRVRFQQPQPGLAGHLQRGYYGLAAAGDFRQPFGRRRKHGAEAATAAVDQRLGQRLDVAVAKHAERSEEHTSELQSLMRISYAVSCLTKKTNTHT